MTELQEVKFFLIPEEMSLGGKKVSTEAAVEYLNLLNLLEGHLNEAITEGLLPKSEMGPIGVSLVKDSISVQEEVMAEVLGELWCWGTEVEAVKDFMESRINAPLGLTRTVPTYIVIELAEHLLKHYSDKSAEAMTANKLLELVEVAHSRKDSPVFCYFSN